MERKHQTLVDVPSKLSKTIFPRRIQFDPAVTMATTSPMTADSTAASDKEAFTDGDKVCDVICGCINC